MQPLPHPALRPPAPCCFLGKVRVGPRLLWVQGPVFLGGPGVERGRQCRGRCLVTPPSWRVGASAPPGDKGRSDMRTGCPLCPDHCPPPNKGVTSQLHAGAAWGRPGPYTRPGNLVGDGCGGQVVEDSVQVWRPACGFLLEAVGGQGGVGPAPGGAQGSASCPAGTLLSVSSPHGGVWCLGWLARRARAPGLPGGHWGSPSPRRLHPGPLTGSAVRVQSLPFLF